jgi:RNA polymerase sigma-B factor
MTALASASDLAPAPPQDASGHDDQELVSLIHSLPPDSARRAAACEVLVGRYQPLVRSCARRYLGSPESPEELMQVGYVGLMKAINRFDPAAGSSLASYAQPCISGEMKRHFRDKRWQVRVRRPAQELVLEIRKATGQLTQELGHSPADSELARHLSVSTADILEARLADLSLHAWSLDAPIVAGADSAKLGELLGEEDPQVQHTLDMTAVAAHWNELPRRQQRILLMRFYGNMTQAEIGARLGISQMHLSRLMTQSLGYLRECLLGPDCGGRAEFTRIGES